MAHTERLNPLYQCHDKRPYRFKMDAKRAVINLQRNGGCKARAYQCPHCGVWRVGHKSPKRRAS
jgi:hypothetical protein